MATIKVTNGKEILEIESSDLPEARANIDEATKQPDPYVPVEEYNSAKSVNSGDRAGSNTSPAVVAPKLSAPVEEKTSLLGDFARNNLDAIKGFPGQTMRSVPVASPLGSRGAGGIASMIDDKAYAQSQGKVDATNKWADDSYSRRHPYYSGAAGLAGGFLLPLPGPKFVPKGAEPKIAQFAKQVANVASGSAIPASIMGADAALLGKDPTGPAILGGVLGGAGTAASEYLPSMLRNLSENRALKATTGANKRELTELLRKGQIDLEGGSNLGRSLLQTDEAGKPVVGWFSDPRKIAENARAKSDFYGKKIGDIGKTIDNVMSEIPPVSGQNIAKSIRREVGGIAPTQANAPSIAKMREQAIEYNNMGDIPFSKGQKFKNAHRYKPGVEAGAPGSVTPRDIENIYKRSVGNELYRSADEAAGMVGNSRAAERSLIEGYPEASKNYGTFTSAADLAENNAVRDFSNRFVRPSSYGVGGLGAFGAVAAGGDAMTAAAAGLVLGGLNNIALSRGNSFVARAAAGAARLLEGKGFSVPFAQKYLPILQKAASNSSRSLAAAHMLLLMKDPEYRQLVTEGSK